jgi:HSP20 family protein
MTEIQAYDPFDELKRIQDRIDSKFGDQFAAAGMNMDVRDAGIRPQDGDITVTVDMPRVDIRRHGYDILLTVHMPGVDENDIDIDVQDDRILEISAQRKNEIAGEEQAGFLNPERQYRFYCRSIMLPAPVDRTKTKAGYNNGVLEISIPMIHGAWPGEVPVSGV